MVSFPDWSRFAATAQSQRGDGCRSLYERQREEESLRLAEQNGFFLVPTSKLLEEKFSEAPPKKGSLLDHSSVDLALVLLVRLETCRVRLLGDIGLCLNVTVCILGDNYLAKFDALSECRHLFKLDLHSNQITWLPDPFFWAGLPRLRILHLHDNPIGDIENIHYMASCPALEVLTLYDTPLCLKRNYRHHAVNTVWTMKALDHFVVSDEEIIEDADFGGRFSTFHSALAIQTCTQLDQSSTWRDEMQAARDVIRRINSIMAHHSPVMIIQKMARGYITRKNLDADRFGKFWHLWVVPSSHRPKSTAAQIKYEEWRRSESHASTVPPPSSPVSLPSVPRATAHVPHVQQTRLDYDTYMRQHRRPGSTVVSEPSVSGSSRYSPDAVANLLHLRTKSSLDKQKIRQISQPDSQTQDTITESAGSSKHFYVDIDKLQTSMLESLHEEALVFDSMINDAPVPPDIVNPASSKPCSSRTIHAREKPHSSAPAIGRTSQRSIVRTSASVSARHPDGDNDSTAVEVPVVEFRLSGLRSVISVYDPLLDMIISRRESGRDVRAGEDEHHRRRQVESSTVRTSIRSNTTDAAKRRMCRRLRGCGMGMLSLHAIQLAYDSRAKAENQALRAGRIHSLREQRDIGRHQRRIYVDDRRTMARTERELDRRRLDELQEKRDTRQRRDHQQSLERRSAVSQRGVAIREDRSFVNDFSLQNTSVSTALARHDRLAKRDDVLQDRLDTVLTQREMDQEQLDVVRRYLEHRQLMRQTETAMSRAVLDSRILAEASERVLEARSRVEHVKARSAHAQTYAPTLPSIASVDVFADHVSKRKLHGTLRKWAGSGSRAAAPTGPHSQMTLTATI